MKSPGIASAPYNPLRLSSTAMFLKCSDKIECTYTAGQKGVSAEKHQFRYFSPAAIISIPTSFSCSIFPMFCCTIMTGEAKSCAPLSSLDSLIQYSGAPVVRVRCFSSWIYPEKSSSMSRPPNV